MIAGIGTDIVEVSRIQEKIDRTETFKKHVFSEAEIEYCDKQKSPAMHYAARWAVKEAYLKAYGVRFIGNHRLAEIETLHNENGRPFIVLHGKEKEHFMKKELTTIHVSISHIHHLAIAYVMIEKNFS